jgi:hypothetical protein
VLNNELERLWKEVIMALVEVLQQYLAGGIDNTTKHLSGWPVSGPGLESTNLVKPRVCQAGVLKLSILTFSHQVCFLLFKMEYRLAGFRVGSYGK